MNVLNNAHIKILSNSRTIVFSRPEEVSDGQENDSVERYKKIVERGAALVVFQLSSSHDFNTETDI